MNDERIEYRGKETYLDGVLSWVAVLITHSGGVCVKRSRAVAKVPQARHRIRSGCDVCNQGHRLIDEGVHGRCMQNSC